MSTKQTRRSISVAGITYNKLRAHADAVDRSMSDIVEELLRPVLGTEPRPAPAPKSERTPSEARDAQREARLRFNPPPIKVKGVPHARPPSMAASLPKRTPDTRSRPEPVKVEPLPRELRRNDGGFQRALELVRR